MRSEVSTVDRVCFPETGAEGTSLAADLLPYVQVPSRFGSNYTLHVQYATIEVIETSVCVLELIFSNEHGENTLKFSVYEHVDFVGEANLPLESWTCSEYSSASTAIGFRSTCAAILPYHDTQVNILVYALGSLQETQNLANSISLVDRTLYERSRN